MTNEEGENLRPDAAKLHKKFPAVGDIHLSHNVGVVIVLCNKILALLNNDNHITLKRYKKLLAKDNKITTKKLFIKNFQNVIISISKLIKLSHIKKQAPIRSASKGENLNWVCDSLPIGKNSISVEYNFEDPIGVPEKEKFHIQ
eukprot:UN27586